MTCRRATIHDSRRILDIRNNLSNTIYANNPEPVSVESHTEWFTNTYLNDFDNYCFVHDVGGTTQAFCRFDLNGDGTYRVSISVDPAYQGCSIGSRLLEESLQLLQVGSVVVAEVHKNDARSITLFSGHGFDLFKRDNISYYFRLRTKCVHRTKARIVYMGNRRIGQRVLKFLTRGGDEIVWSTVEGEQLPPDSELSSLLPEIGVSVYYPHLIPERTIGLFPKGIINLHPSLLPFGRGALPVLWAIAEGTPMGVTLHYIDKGIDTGDIISQCHVGYHDHDTCRELYDVCVEVGIGLFVRNWGAVKNGNINRIPQLRGRGTFHQVKDVMEPTRWFDKTVVEIRRQWGKPT